MTAEEYKSKHDGAYIYSQAARWKMSQSDRDFPEDFSQTCRQAQLSRFEEEEVWNKGETKHTHESIARQASKMSEKMSGEGNPFYGQSHSEETRRILSSKSEKNWKKPSLRKKFLLSRTKSLKSGDHVSLVHAKVIQGMVEAGLWDEYNFDHEVYLTMGDGQPRPIDIASRREKVAVEIDGCVFHRCPSHGNYDDLPSDWKENVDSNVHADAITDQSLRSFGWDIERIWEHDVKDDLAEVIDRIAGLVGEEIDSSSLNDAIIEDIRDLDPWVLDLVVDDDQGDLSDRTDEEILEYYRTVGFPYVIFDEKEIVEDFDRLRSFDSGSIEEGDDRIFIHPSHRVGEKGVRHFMSHRWSTSSKGYESAYSKWEDDEFLMRLIQNRRDHASTMTDASMRTGLKLLCRVPKIFPSVLSKYIADEYAPEESTVLDPSAGWGSRMVGSLASEKVSDYVGVDPWEETFGRLDDLKKSLRFGSSVRLINSPFEDASLSSRFDLIFTSPPHFDKEHYTDDPTQSDVRYDTYDDWKEGFLRVLISKSFSCLREGGHLILHLTDSGPHPLVRDAVRMMEELEMEVKSPIRWSRHHVFTNSDRSERLVVAEKV